MVEIQELKETCKEKEVEKKYYDIFTSSKPRVENVKEFKELMNKEGLSNEDIINIMYETIKNNIISYGERE